MTQPTEAYAEQYSDGRRVGLSGAARESNPFSSEPKGSNGQQETAEVWRSKFDIWRQGWMEGHDAFERVGVPK